MDFGRALHGERLVRAFGIELVHEGVEASLQLQAILPWRSGGFLLQGQVHALVVTVRPAATPQHCCCGRRRLIVDFNYL
jgi:hypothetical protein